MADREFEGVGAIEAKVGDGTAQGADVANPGVSSTENGGSEREQVDVSPRKYTLSEDAIAVSEDITAHPDAKRTAAYNKNDIKLQGVADLPNTSKKFPPDNDCQDSDEDDDDEAGQFQIVKKSIYKSPKKGSILHRLTGLATTSSKSKYAPSALVPDSEERPYIEGVSPTNRKAEHQQLDEINLNDEDGNVADTQIALEEEEPIDVAIARLCDQEETLPSQSQLVPSKNSQSKTFVESLLKHQRVSKDDQDAPQVVIHSGESDSETGFATLNPIISAKRKLIVPTTSSRLATVATMDASPFLSEIPLRERSKVENVEASPANYLLVINALGATGLPKVEKFGTQSTLLEMQLCSKCSAGDDSQPLIMRSGLHKKGGSEAQWNQQFSVSLSSKEDQHLQITVKTNNRMIVGQAFVPLGKIGDLFYDQHYQLYRSEESSEEEEVHAFNTEPAQETQPAGMVHLQLKITDMSAIQTVPPLHLPFPKASEPALPPVFSPNSAATPHRISPMLANGGLFFKVPFHNSSVIGYSAIPRRQWVAVAKVDQELVITWCDPAAPTATEKKRSESRSLLLSLVIDVTEGHATKAFEFHKASNVVKESSKCFSLIAKNRTLDLVAASKEEATLWVSSLREIVSPSTSQSSETVSLQSARTIQDYRQVALSSRQETRAENPTKKKQQLAVWKNKLFELARRNQLDAIAACLHDGCPVDLLEVGTGDTLLIAACREGNAPLVQLCLSWRAKNDPHPEFGDTALQVAVAHQNAECLKLLLLTAAKSEMDSEIVNHIDSNSDAPLHVAARNGDFACLQLLLLHGADICVVDEIGRTPLHCAVSVAHQGGTDCIAYLLDVGGDSVLNLGDAEGDTPLHYAALAGNDNAVKVLLESAADALAVNSNEETPLDIARRVQHQRCADFIAPYCVVPHEDDKPAHYQETQDTKDEEDNEDALQGHRRHHSRRDHHRHQHKHTVQRDAEEDGDDYGIDHSDDHESMYDSSGYSSSQHESPSRPSTMNLRDQPWAVQHSDYSVTEFPYQDERIAFSQLPLATLSPSEQVRAALSRQQRSFSASGGSKMPMSARTIFETPSHINFAQASTHYPATARDWTSASSEQHPLYWMNGQQVLPERGNRTRQFEDPYANKSMHSQTQSDMWRNRLRSQSESGYGSRWGYGDSTQAWAIEDSPMMTDRTYHSRTAYPNADNSLYQREYVPQARETSCFTQDIWARRPATADAPPVTQKWDLMYTQDGYPYYVNRQTGTSQWEKPQDFEAISPPHPTPIHIQAAPISRNPDEIIRMRLAQARRQQPVSSPFRRHQSMVEVGSGGFQYRPDVTSKPSYGGAYPADSVFETKDAEEAKDRNEEPTRVESVTAAQSQVIPVSPTSPSTYQTRTGLRLSIDISSPPSKDRKLHFSHTLFHSIPLITISCVCRRTARVCTVSSIKE